MERGSRTNKGTDCATSYEAVASGSPKTRIVLLAFLFSLVTLMGSGWYGWRLCGQLKNAESEHHRIIELKGVIIHLDEVLTMSARMAAATGDPAWEQRYRSFEPQLDTTIKEAMALAPQDFMSEAVDQTDVANVKLVAIENEAFHFVRDKNLEAAVNLLNSQEYSEQKLVYNEGMKRYAVALEKYIEAKSNKHRNKVLGVTVFASFVLLLAVFSGIYALELRNRMSEREQTKKEVKHQRENLKAMFDAAPVGMLLIDENIVVKQINDVAARLVGKNGDDILNMQHGNGLGCVHSNDDPNGCGHGPACPQCPTRNAILETLSSGQSAHSDDVQAAFLVDGERVDVWLEIHAEPVNFDNKRYVLLALNNVTYRKRAEEATKQACEELEKANAELKEMQSQIVQSEKLASIGQLAAGVAHEINTPIGFVASNFETLEDYVTKIKKLLGMYAELINEVEDSGKADLLNKAGTIAEGMTDMKIDFILEDVQGLFDDSREGLDRVMEIVQNLRDFSRIDQPGSLDEYDLNSGIEATLIVANNEIKYDADIKTKLSQLPTISCNSGQINQVLLNILVNAAQAIKSQEKNDNGAITIRTYPTETEVVCEISDDGPGIPTDQQAKIFDPFFTTKPVGEGTGLGLSVSYDIIVHKHKGKLLVESEVGKGTKFTLKLPITKDKEPNDRKETESNGQTNSTICG